ncbi:MAG: hypothetical protein LBL36_02885 [Clostridiales Family XIII bacterium]|jgi:hypothetical protein|nr:hypothetical protein [Clostridiales Family XIII bacterium]
MAQLSLYLDNTIYEQLTERAKAAHKSKSLYVSESLQRSFDSGWREGFFDLFGSIKDESFRVPDDPAFSGDEKGIRL